MKSQTNEKRLTASVVEASEMLGISRNLAYALVKSGELPSLKLGSRRIVIPLAALEQYLAGNIKDYSVIHNSAPISAQEKFEQLSLFNEKGSD